jgi:sugar/nucleoside kinase (ribokinase family)
MLDKFIVGRVTRISPEAPVPVVAFTHDMHRMGGAANVAHNVVSLGGQATLVALTGLDDTAATLAEACREAGIAPSLVGDAGRPTTTKVRIVTERNQQVARVDYESDSELAGDIEQRILTEVQKHAARAAAIVVSDYLKGGVTRRVVAAAVAGARPGVPVLVDPKVPHLDYYEGATLVTPNHHEAAAATTLRIRSDAGVPRPGPVRPRADDARGSGHVAARGRHRFATPGSGARGGGRHRRRRHGHRHCGARPGGGGKPRRGRAPGERGRWHIGDPVRTRGGDGERTAEGRRERRHALRSWGRLNAGNASAR